jgi:hypothetical protein
VAGHHLTAHEQERLEHDGYVVREDAFTLDEVAEITGHCEALVERVVANRQGHRITVGSYVFDPDMLTGVTIKWEGDSDVVHGLEPFAHMAPELETWGYDPRFVDPMVAFVGDDNPILFTEKLNLKRPYKGGPNPLHQDFPYWQFAIDPHRIATAMIFLDDASVENGTLWVVPGSHTQGQWRNRTDSDPFGNLEIDPELDVAGKAVPLEVAAGSVVFFGAFLVHKSQPNTSGKDRRALLYSYQPAGQPHAREQMRAPRRKAAAS